MRHVWAKGAAVILAAGVQTSAAFACQGGMTQVLRCDTTTGKQVEICIGDGKASYSYGPSGTPELALTQNLGDVGGSAWNGVGRYEFESIDFTNNGFTYNMIATRDRLVLDAGFEVGIEVTDVDGDIVAGVACVPERTDFRPQEIDRGFVRAGFCWDRTALRYNRSCS